MEMLLRWAMRFVEDLADDIISATTITSNCAAGHRISAVALVARAAEHFGL
jgi:hypothetical protein